MAQDFGDEVGNAIFDFFKRQVEHYFLYGNGNNKMNEWLRRSGKRQGLTDEQAKANAKKLSKRELVTIPSTGRPKA